MSLLNKSDDELRAAAETLRKAGIRRNRIPITEFQQFQPLWEPQDLDDPVVAASIQRINNEFAKRFNPYAPIIIVENNTAEAAIIKQYPALLTPVKTFNETDGGTSELDFFESRLNSPGAESPLRQDTTIASARLQRRMGELADADAITDARSLMDDALDDDEQEDLDTDDFIWD